MEYEPSLAHLRYNKFQNLGAQRRRWIENTDEPNCPVSLSTLTFADLRQNLGFPLPRRENIDAIFARQVIELGLPNEFGKDSDGHSSAYSRFESPAGTDFIWNGNTGPGVIVIDEVERSPSSTAPRIAYMTKAIYEYGFPLASLSHVLISTIINRNTRRFLKKMLYAPKNNLTWPTLASTSREFPPLTWKHGTAEYDGLLGTELGKIISCLVLSAYPRGTRQISRIVTWHFPLCMRFDIEDIPN